MTAPTPDPSNRAHSYSNAYAGQPSAAEWEGEPGDYAPRRKRHRGRKWLIALVVLIALLVAADRVAVVVVEGRLASKIQSSQRLGQKPGVSIAGFPFLTQVASRDFGRATIDIHNLDAHGVPIAHIHVDLSGVHASSAYNSATVDTLNGVATLNYTDVSTALSTAVNVGHITLSRGSDGGVVASYKLLGAAVTTHVSVALLAGNVLEIKSTKVGTKVSSLGLSVPTDFDAKIPLGGLPFGMQLKGLQVTAEGVDISAIGHNVLLTGGSVVNGN
ncbi:MAG: LmeA family phospholipid-binding protein [Actinocrinis sp.]